MTIEERIEELEAEIRKTPHHKGTDHYIGRLRGRIAQLKSELLGSFTRSSGGSGGGGYAVKKSGQASVVLVGPPSVGKSSLLNRLTDAQSKIGEYDFTTLWVIPGMMKFQNASIQLFDLPGIIEGAAIGKGRGKEVLSVVRNCDLVIILVDIRSINKIEQIKKELYEFGVRLDETEPKMFIKKEMRGGIKVSSGIPLSHVSIETIQELAKEFHIRNGEIIIKENITLDRLIDGFMGNRIYLPYLVVINKADLLTENKKVQKNLPTGSILISATNNQGMGQLKEIIWQKLNIIRVYLKPKNSEVDYTDPVIVKRGINLQKILEDTSMPNKDLITRVKVYGPGAKFSGQEVSFSFQPQEGTIVSFLP